MRSGQHRRGGSEWEERGPPCCAKINSGDGHPGEEEFQPIVWATATCLSVC